jgi:transcriptional regulator with PAS, ATPase and Fis domain
MTELDTISETLWIKEFPGTIIVCDPDGIILEMNDKAARGYESEGGLKLIGSNLLDCHPAKAREKVEEMLATRVANIYTIEKKGLKKLVYQSPWYRNGEYAGFVELVLEVPFEMPHFVRS